MRTMPNLKIFNPADATSTAACARLCHQSDGPSYVRIEKGLLHGLYAPDHNFSPGLSQLREGADALIISTGYLTQTAVKVSAELQAQGVDCGVLDLYRIKPLNTGALLTQLRKAKRIIIMEEQTPIGGIGSLVCELLGEHGLAVPVRRYHLPDAPCYRYGSREWLHQEFGLDVTTVAREAADWLREKNGVSPQLETALTGI